MPVTDDIVATVRAYLQGNTAEFKELNATLDRAHEASAAYKAMIIAAFIVAIQRRFTKDSSRDAIIEYVADIRSRGPNLPEVIDASAAERMIASVFTGETLRDIDSRMKVSIQMHFATAIVNDEGLQGQALDAFLADARKLAGDLLA